MQSSIVSKLFLLLTIISETRKPMTFSELVTKSGVNKSTIHRILSICMEEQLVQFDSQRKSYLLGPKVFNLVKNAYNGYDIQAISLDEMMRLHDLFGENITIGIPSGMEVVYLRLLEADIAWGSMQRPGMREPVHCSASGKALLAFLPDKIIDAKLKGYNFERLTDQTITSEEGFKDALNAVREAGYATNDREEYDHLVGISAPIFNYMSEPIAVLNIWSVKTHHTLADLKGWAEELVLSSGRVTGLIGGNPPNIESLSSDRY